MGTIAEAIYIGSGIIALSILFATILVGKVILTSAEARIAAARKEE